LSLALLGSSHHALASTPAQSASKEQWRAAQKLFQAADELYDAGKYSEAITAYRASYDIVGSPNSRLMIARSLRALERFTEASKELELAEREASSIAALDEKYAQTAGAARAERTALWAENGRLQVVLKGAFADAAVTIDGRRVSKQELTQTLVLAPGRLTIVASAAHGPSSSRQLELTAGAQQSIVFEGPTSNATTPEPSAGNRHGALVWTSAGIGAAGFAAFVVLGTLNTQTFHRLESSCPDQRCSADQRDEITTGKRYQLLANVGLGVAAAGLGTAAALWLLGRDARPERRANLPALTLSSRSAQVQWQGNF
jgi:hypothetical protein